MIFSFWNPLRLVPFPDGNNATRTVSWGWNDPAMEQASRLRLRRICRGDDAPRAVTLPPIGWARRTCSPADRYRVIHAGGAA